MNCVKSYQDLYRRSIRNRKQFWFYVIVLNLCDLSPAGEKLLNSLDYFHLDSGEDCVYFMPGFLNTGNGFFNLNNGSSERLNLRELRRFFGGSPQRHLDPTTINIRNYGRVQFFIDSFLDCIHEFERNNTFQWRYSGECELLLFNVDQYNHIIPGDFASYNLDDIIRNGRNISSFIRATINVGKDAIDQQQAKRELDEIYASLILPTSSSEETFRFNAQCAINQLNQNGFQKNQYYFISYSSKDYHFVSRIRDAIERTGIKCWMAPRDIPRGTNYAHVIEIAIQNAQQFILVLSENSIWSVWVEKELQRAIHHFQHEYSSKIAAVWKERQIDLDNTPMAYPIEGIQILGSLNRIEDYRMLLPADVQNKLQLKDRIQVTANYFHNNIIGLDWFQKPFGKLLGIAISMVRDLKEYGDEALFSELEKLCDDLRQNIQKMKTFHEMEAEYYEVLTSSFKLENKIEKAMKEILSCL